MNPVCGCAQTAGHRAAGRACCWEPLKRRRPDRSRSGRKVIEELGLQFLLFDRKLIEPGAGRIGVSRRI